MRFPFFLISFFDSYNEQCLSYYKVYDVKLSYSLDMVLKEILPSGIILVAFVISAYLAAYSMWEMIKNIHSANWSNHQL